MLRAARALPDTNLVPRSRSPDRNDPAQTADGGTQVRHEAAASPARVGRISPAPVSKPFKIIMAILAVPILGLVAMVISTGGNKYQSPYEAEQAADPASHSPRKPVKSVWCQHTVSARRGPGRRRTEGGPPSAM